MHTGPMADSEGMFQGWTPCKVDNPDFKCRICGSDEVRYRTWDSSDGAYTDYQYECKGCERTWWVEGADA